MKKGMRGGREHEGWKDIFIVFIVISTCIFRLEMAFDLKYIYTCMVFF